jgi:hypothetical protein
LTLKGIFSATVNSILRSSTSPPTCQLPDLRKSYKFAASAE